MAFTDCTHDACLARASAGRVWQTCNLFNVATCAAQPSRLRCGPMLVSSSSWLELRGWCFAPARSPRAPEVGHDGCRGCVRVDGGGMHGAEVKAWLESNDDASWRVVVADGWVRDGWLTKARAGT